MPPACHSLLRPRFAAPFIRGAFLSAARHPRPNSPLHFSPEIGIITEKDYISHPKPNGYRSLHLTIRLPVFFAEKEIHVPVEIQLRTIAMDFWASLEHTIRYKKNLPINAEIETELKECADSSREWDGKMEHLLHILT